MNDEDDDFPLPPSPSPAPKLRPNGPRGRRTSISRQQSRPTITNTFTTSGLSPPPDVPVKHHARETSGSSFSSYKGVPTSATAALSIRPVTDQSLAVRPAGQSPYPTKPSHFLYPTNSTASGFLSRNSTLLDQFPIVPTEGPKVVNLQRSNSSLKKNSAENDGTDSKTKDPPAIPPRRNPVNHAGNSRPNNSNIGVKRTKGLDDLRTRASATATTDSAANTLLGFYTSAVTTSDKNGISTPNKSHKNPGGTTGANPSPAKITAYGQLPTTYKQTTTSDTPKVRDARDTHNEFIHNAATPSQSSLFPVVSSLPTLLSHQQHNEHEPRLVPESTARGISRLPLSSKNTINLLPGEVDNDNEEHETKVYTPYTKSYSHQSQLNDYNDYSDDSNNYYTFSSSPPYYPFTPGGIDVDRLAMVGGDLNINNDHLGVPPFLTPRELQTQQSRHGSSSSPLEPGTLSTSNRSSGGLAGIASAASELSFDSTPMSTGNESVGSSGTVVRKRGYTGQLPAGYYSLFPPVSTPQAGSSRPSSSRPRSVRSSSAPPRPVSEGPLSPLSAGSNSPVSPVSPDENASLHRSGSQHTRSRSDSLWNNMQPLQTPTVIVAEPSSSRSSQFSLNQIPRKPVGRSNAVRWNSYMSTIASESEGDTRSTDGLSSIERTSNLTANILTSPTSTTGKAGEDFRRSSPVIPPSSTYDDAPTTSATINFSDTDSAFPMAEPTEAPTPVRRRVSSAVGKQQEQQRQEQRQESVVSYASLPSRKQSKTIISPTSMYSERADYRDSYSQTDTGTQAGRTGSLRDSIPAWARLYYSNERRHRETLGRASSPSSRRHTVGSTWGYPDSLRIAPGRTGPRGRAVQHNRQVSAPEDRSIFHGEDIRSPRLYHSRHAALRRRSMFIAPSIDEDQEGSGLTRRNIQVWCFAIGFIFPIAWWVAAFLPLPPCPRTPPASPGFEHDLEKTLGPIDQARYENARWWRNINAIMSVVGVGVIVAIIVLAVVASKMSNGGY